MIRFYSFLITSGAMPTSLIICITGMPGAGKTTVANMLKKNHFKIITMGDVIREEATRQGLEQDDVNLGKLMLELRQDLGLGAIAHLIVQNLAKDHSMLIAIDGIRSMQEVEVLRNHGVVKILGIHTPKDSRFKYLMGRGRKDAPNNEEEFLYRDKRELDLGLSKVISYSDSILTNDMTLKELQEKVLEITQRWCKEVETTS